MRTVKVMFGDRTVMDSWIDGYVREWKDAAYPHVLNRGGHGVQPRAEEGVGR